MGFLSALNFPFDASVVLRKRKALRRELLARDISWLEKKIAVLGGSSTQDIVSTLEVFLLNEGIRATFYESEYGLYREDALFANPALENFAPDLILFHTTWRNLGNFPTMTDSLNAAQDRLEAEKARWQELWENAAQRYHCAIIQNNFELPPWRLLGNRDCLDPRGGSAFVAAMNDFVQDWARNHNGFYLHDLNYVAADYGLSRWHDTAAWHLYKYAMAISAIPGYAYSLTALIRALLGKSKKALALDMDNTLWGGVIGDDGVDGIILGPETAQGAAYQEFQAYVRRLTELGILLTVNSKNEETNALAGLGHPQGKLHADDFALIKANWQPKDRNLVETAEALNIGIDSFVFVDDNPVERELVAQSLPQVSVPEIDKVENYIHILDRAAWFEPASLTEEDMSRGRMYAENARRDIARQTFADYDSYLDSLNMRACIAPITEAQVPRVTQLTNKTNQFNLTTRRYTEAEIRRTLDDPEQICLTGTLSDKFGDNGIVSVILGRRDGDVCHIELWLMSCRVLKRDMEREMLNVFVSLCGRQGIRRIEGKYIPTAKNAMVANLFPQCGFTPVASSGDGTTIWELQVDEFLPTTTHISLGQE